MAELSNVLEFGKHYLDKESRTAFANVIVDVVIKNNYVKFYQKLNRNKNNVYYKIKQNISIQQRMEELGQPRSQGL